MPRSFMRKMLASLALIMGTAAAGSAVAAGYSNMYVFGDSLSDSGNLFAATANPAAPYWQGRFSNGPTYAEDLAGKLGLSAKASLLGGTNFSFAGATAGPGSDYLYGIPNLSMQVSSFRAMGGVADADANALYVVWAGANDIRYFGGNGILGVQMGLASAISGLYDEGARNFLVMNLPDLGLTPESRLAGVSAGATAVSSSNNGLFNMNMNTLRGGLAGSDIRTLDTFSLLNTVVANPAAYGLSNVTDNCLLAGAACTPDSYLFWDAIHPTAAGHRLIASAAYSVVAIPEPETYAMLLMGLGLLGLVARRRRVQAA